MPDPECPGGRVRGPGQDQYQWFDPLVEIGLGEGFESDWFQFFRATVGQGYGQRFWDVDAFCAGDYPEDLPMEPEDLIGVDLRVVLEHWGRQYFRRRVCSCGP